VIESAGVLLGPLLGAVLLHGTSIGTVFLCAAGAYLVSVVLLLPIRPEPAASRDDRETVARPGLAAVTASSDVRIVLVLYAAQNLVAGALNVLVVVTALRLLGLVEIDGRLVRSLGSGDSFGEIALLRDVPRTATIRARGGVSLLRLDRRPFLDNVTGNVASSRAADGVIGSRLGLSLS
jgi:Cyclic nucleotide-binding domain